MTLSVYADVLFILNFMADFLLLRTTGFFIRKKPKTTRLFTASICGALYAVAAVFQPFGNGISLFLSFFAALCMVGICYGTKKICFLLKSAAVFYLTSFVCAGVCFLLCIRHTQKNASPFFLTFGAVYKDVNAYLLLTAFLIGFTVLHIGCGYIRKRRIKSGYLYRVAVEKDGNKIMCTALFDTGNFLTEPISQRDVMIAEWNAVKDLFPFDTLQETVTSIPGEFLYIPCRTLESCGGMFAFCPDSISAEKLLLPDTLYIGITESPLDAEGSYQMILPNSATDVAERIIL